MTSRSRSWIAAALLTGVLATLPACNNDDSSGKDSSAKGSSSEGASGKESGSDSGQDGSGQDSQVAPGEKDPAGGGGSACRSLTATADVKAAVKAAYSRSFPQFQHVKPTAGSFYYGQCGGTRYAGTTFSLTAGHSEKEAVGMQDEGATMKYFSSTGGNWSYLASGALELAEGCKAVKQIPAEMARVWGDCPAG
ncbi:hypothetical protein ABVG11_23520 [Streptomyces sp. HD1123-B1]|uniref:hypothetical protein n=1 Tax=Streptomyces huangiella TaxID=3228804 RepID=UPI003D7DABB5